VTSHGFSADEIDAIKQEVSAHVDECAEKALASPMPDPSQAAQGVFAEEWEPLGDGNAPWSRWSEKPSNGAARNGAV